jgi:hypothetical protein
MIYGLQTGKSKLYDPQIGVDGVLADTTPLGYR